MNSMNALHNRVTRRHVEWLAKEAHDRARVALTVFPYFLGGGPVELMSLAWSAGDRGESSAEETCLFYLFLEQYLLSE